MLHAIEAPRAGPEDRQEQIEMQQQPNRTGRAGTHLIVPRPQRVFLRPTTTGRDHHTTRDVHFQNQRARYMPPRTSSLGLTVIASTHGEGRAVREPPPAYRIRGSAAELEFPPSYEEPPVYVSTFGAGLQQVDSWPTASAVSTDRGSDDRATAPNLTRPVYEREPAVNGMRHLQGASRWNRAMQRGASEASSSTLSVWQFWTVLAVGLTMMLPLAYGIAVSTGLVRGP